jgi:hypothetical protein
MPLFGISTKELAQYASQMPACRSTWTNKSFMLATHLCYDYTAFLLNPSNQAPELVIHNHTSKPTDIR